ncbi:efflux RND transporter periplasmic adaptor subunit [bacterium]|nr:efflux RND transporter periplasmic adaptor subunit [bacterium]
MKKLCIALAALLFSCGNNHHTAVYNGRLEAETVTISAAAAGTIDSLFTEEGATVAKGERLALIDSRRYAAELRRQKALLHEVRLNGETLQSHIQELRPQLDLAERTLAKTETLLREGAATEQQRDELRSRAQALRAKMDGLVTQEKIIASKTEQLAAAVEVAALNYDDTRISAPLEGTILNVYRRPGESAAPGIPLFEIADLRHLEATIYIPLASLPSLQPGQRVLVTADGGYGPFPGTVSWIASEAEFTPKTIFTRETRATLVYAVKIEVPNEEGRLKIGMPVDVELIPPEGR